MGITKILIIALLIWVAFKVYSFVKFRAKNSDDYKLNKKIIPCSFCKTHIPLTSAIKERDINLLKQAYSKVVKGYKC